MDDPTMPDFAVLARYIAGDASDAERAEVDAWRAGHPERDAELEALRRITGTWAGMRPEVESAGSWNAMQVRIAGTAGRSWQKGVGTTTPVLRGGRAMWRPTLRALLMATAAAGCAVFATVLFRTHGGLGTSQEYVTRAGQRASVLLPDGTRLILAPESRLRVRPEYASGDRAVVLDGEAFFVVAHDAAHPFSVRVRGTTVTDIGTQFNVQGYANDLAVRVAVAEGRVGLLAAASRSPKMTLGAGDVATVSDTGVAIAHAVRVDDLSSWVSGDLRFHGTPLPEVAKVLSRWYDLDVSAADSRFDDRLITLSAGQAPVDQVLAAIAAAAHARVARHGRRVTFSVNPGDE